MMKSSFVCPTACNGVTLFMNYHLFLIYISEKIYILFSFSKSQVIMSNEIEDMELACRVLYSQNGSVYLVQVGKCDYGKR